MKSSGSVILCTKQHLLIMYMFKQYQIFHHTQAVNFLIHFSNYFFLTLQQNVINNQISEPNKATLMYVTHSLLSHFAEVINSIDEGTLSWLNSRSNKDVYDTSMNDYTRRTFQPFFYKPNFCCCLNYYYCFYLIFFCRNNVIYI